MTSQPRLDPEFVRRHHVHYDLLPEEIEQGGGRKTVAFDLQLFASHERPLRRPACARCKELLDELRAFARQLVQDEGPATAPTDIVAHPEALYQSHEASDQDEVWLSIRIGPMPPGARSEDPAVAGLRQRLEEMGVGRRS